MRAILDKARQEAQSAADGIVKQAQAEAEAAKQRAQRDIASARDQALAEIWQKTADMAVSVAGRVLSKELTEADQRRLLDAAIPELPASGPTATEESENERCHRAGHIRGAASIADRDRSRSPAVTPRR